MSKREKLIEKMIANPKGDWTIENLKSLADWYDVPYRQPGTSHVTFRFDAGIILTVPAHRPLKPIYVKKFIALLSGE